MTEETCIPLAEYEISDERKAQQVDANLAKYASKCSTVIKALMNVETDNYIYQKLLPELEEGVSSLLNAAQTKKATTEDSQNLAYVQWLQNRVKELEDALVPFAEIYEFELDGMEDYDSERANCKVENGLLENCYKLMNKLDAAAAKQFFQMGEAQQPAGKPGEFVEL